MKQECDAGQRRQVFDAEHMRDQAAGERHGAQPQETDGRRKQINRQRCHRQHDEYRDDHRACEIEQRQQVFLGVPSAEPAPHITADHVEKADQREADHAGFRCHFLIDQVCRKMHGDEQQLKTADRIGRAQQQETAVGEGLAQRFSGGLLEQHGGLCTFVLDQCARQRNDHQHGDGKHHQRLHPADLVDQPLAIGQHRKLAE